MEPIISPYLLVEELDTRMPLPLPDDIRSIYSDIKPANAPSKPNESIRDENIIDAFPKASLVDSNTSSNVGVNIISPIKDRRNMGHVPSIITNRHEGIEGRPYTPPFSPTTGDYMVSPPTLTPTPHSPPMIGHVTPILARTPSGLARTPTNFTRTSPILGSTPPILAQTLPMMERSRTLPLLSQTPPILTHTRTSPALANTPIWNNTNPFETSANPFAVTVPTEAPENITLSRAIPHSNNPFEDDDNLSIHSANIGQMERRSSLLSAGRRLSLSLSRSSGSDKKRHTFNPLKLLSRRSSMTDPSKETPKEKPKIFTAVKNGLKRDSSSRRNALHGPF